MERLEKRVAELEKILRDLTSSSPDNQAAAATAARAPKPAAPIPAFHGQTDTAFGRNIAEVYRDKRRGEADVRPDSAIGPNRFFVLERQAPVTEGAPPIEGRGPISRTLQQLVSSGVGMKLFDRAIDRRTTGASIEFGNEDSRLGLQFSLPWASMWIDPKDETERIHEISPRLNALTFGFSAKSEDNFGSLNGDIRATFGFNRTHFKTRSFVEAVKEIQTTEKALAEECRADKFSKPPVRGLAELTAACSGEALRLWMVSGDGGKYVHAKSREKLADAVWAQTRPELDYGVSAELGYQWLKYRHLDSSDPADVAAGQPFNRKERTAEKIPWELSAYVGGFAGYSRDWAPHFYGAILAEVGREYDFASEHKGRTVCPSPTVPTSFVKCEKDLNTAPPEANDYLRVGVQGKMLIVGGALIPRIGIAPKFTIDLKDGQFAYDFPISFLESSDGKLTAGVRFKGEEGGKNPSDFSAGIFLGKAFSLGD